MRRSSEAEQRESKGKGAVGMYGSESKEAQLKREMEVGEQEEGSDEVETHVSKWKKNVI